jgi:hypothetical protein
MRYVASLRRNGLRHQFGVLGITFSDSGPVYVECTDAEAAAYKAAIDKSDAKCPGIKASLVFELADVPRPAVVKAKPAKEPETEPEAKPSRASRRRE